MLSTLKEGQDVLVFNWAYLFIQPKVGDMVVVKVGRKEVLKRIQKISDREYFVTGDNEKDSLDSRKFGPIDKSEIIGKVIRHQ